MITRQGIHYNIFPSINPGCQYRQSNLITAKPASCPVTRGHIRLPSTPPPPPRQIVKFHPSRLKFRPEALSRQRARPYNSMQRPAAASGRAPRAQRLGNTRARYFDVGSRAQLAPARRQSLHFYYTRTLRGSGWLGWLARVRVCVCVPFEVRTKVTLPSPEVLVSSEHVAPRRKRFVFIQIYTKHGASRSCAVLARQDAARACQVARARAKQRERERRSSSV